MSEPSNLADLLTRPASQHGDRVALALGGQRLTYAQLDVVSNQVSNLLRNRGMGRGDKVALSCPNLPDFTAIYFGILKAGATVVPLNVLLRPREIAYHLNDSDATAYFAIDGMPALPVGEHALRGFHDAPRCRDFLLIDGGIPPTPALEKCERYVDAVRNLPTDAESVAVNSDDTAVILYTSGTTGQPKGAELRHRNMIHNALLGPAVFGMDPARPDTCLCALPLFHSFGQTIMQNAVIAHGGTIVMTPRFDPAQAFQLMQREQVTLFGGVPTMYWALLGALTDNVDIHAIASNLRLAIAGGAALPAEIHKQFKQRFGVTIAEGYGLSETSPAVSFMPLGADVRVGSVGVPVPGVAMKLVKSDWSDSEPGSVGEIAVRGPNVMKGYYKKPAATAEAVKDGWFRTGDLARRDEDGYYFLVERSKDMIIRGGFNVYPREVEEVLMSHPEVSLVAVIGIPHASHGEEIKAVVVPVPGATTTSAELIAFAKDQLAAYKYPRVVEFRDGLPMTSTGKILKRELS